MRKMHDDDLGYGDDEVRASCVWVCRCVGVGVGVGVGGGGGMGQETRLSQSRTGYSW